MNIDAVYQPTCETATKAQGVATVIKRIILKIIKALSFDADAIFKSKEWPHLWRK